MAISSQTARVQYTLTGSGQTLAVPFPFLAASDLAVISTNPVTGLDTVLTLNTNYVVTGTGAGSGAVRLLRGMVGDVITITRGAQLVQPAPFSYNSQFPAATVEQVADRLTMLVQQVLVAAKRALRLPLSSGDVGELTTVARAGKLVAFKEGTGALDLTLSLEALRTLVIANPVAALSSVTDYGSISDEVTDVADYGSIV
jgi:hypothetical protein